MEKFEKEVSQDIDAVLERTTYEIKKRTKEPANIDEELPDESSLPAPLLPALPDKPPETGGINLPKTPNLGIEDYLSSSDCTSLLSLDLSGETDFSIYGRHDFTYFFTFRYESGSWRGQQPGGLPDFLPRILSSKLCHSQHFV